MNFQVKGMSGYVWGVPGCARVYAGVRGLAWVWAGVHGYALVCACMLDEFSEFLPENRVPTSAVFNAYPIRIFIYYLSVETC